MSTYKQQTLRLLNLDVLPSDDPFGYITINNSIKIPRSADSTNKVSDNANAAIYIKDINSSISNNTGIFYPLNVNSLLTTVPSLYFNGDLIISTQNMLSEIENILEYFPIELSNIIVDGGYINFYNGTIPNSNQGSSGVGLRYSSNNTVQFKNFDTDWIDLVDITKHDQFSELVDVDVYSNPLLNNQYITYNATSNLFVNSNLAIINDINPTLGGDLTVGDHFIRFSNSSSRLVYKDNTVIDNNLVVLKNNTTFSGVVNYLEINNADIADDPSIIAKSSVNLNIGLKLETSGDGNIQLNASLGNIYANSDSLVISGYVQNSIYRTSAKPGGYLPDTTWNVPFTSDTILFDFNSATSTGTYWANVGAGLDGQKLNIIYNNKSSNVISVLVDFGSNGVIVGTGFASGLNFTTVGQSSSLIYLGEDIDAWQVLNTGSGVY
jgi:hypothetical protein